MSTCPVCYREQSAGLLCHACTSLIERELAEVPAVVAELDVTLSKQARIEQGGSSGLARERNPIGEKAVDPRWVLGNVLGTWARDVSGETWLPDVDIVRVRRNVNATIQGPFCLTCVHRSCQAIRAEERRAAPPIAAQAAHYLLSSIDPIRRHPAVNELVDEILDAVRLARRTVDRLADRQYLGVCRHHTEGVACPEELWARPDAAEARCKVCGHEHDVAKRRAWLLQQAANLIVTPREAARLIGEVGHIHIGEQRVRNYVDRGRIPARPAADGLMRFRLGDLLDVVLEDGERRSA